MITRMYKVTDERGGFKYFNDRDHANSAHYNHGLYVSCFIDFKSNTCHELECDYTGNKNDGRKILKKLSERYGSCEYLDTTKIQNLKDGLYDACLFKMGWPIECEDIIITIELDKSKHHRSKTMEDIQENGIITRGNVLQIDGNSYTLYRKLNEFTSKLNLKNNSNQRIGGNATRFFPLPKIKGEIEMKLTPDEEKNLENILLNAKKKAIEEIIVARTKNNKSKHSI